MPLPASECFRGGIELASGSGDVLSGEWAGGGFDNEGSATLRRVTATNNTASLGGGANLGRIGTRALRLNRNEAAAGNLFNRSGLSKI